MSRRVALVELGKRSERDDDDNDDDGNDDEIVCDDASFKDALDEIDDADDDARRSVSAKRARKADVVELVMPDRWVNNIRIFQPILCSDCWPI